MHRHISTFALSEHIFLWNNRIGRGLQLSKEAFEVYPRHPAVQARLNALGMNHHEQCIEKMIPHRSRWSILHENTLHHPIPAQRTSGGYRYQNIVLTERQRRFWLHIDGYKTCAQIAKECSITPQEFYNQLKHLCTFEIQALQLREKGLGTHHRALLQLHTPPLPQNHRNEHMYDEYGGTTLDTFHSSEITDAQTHFDNVEITLAHALEAPHPSLEMLPFGASLAKKILSLAKNNISNILELGPGTGALAQAWYTQHQPQRYIRMDASQELLKAQKARIPQTESMCALAPDIPLPDNSIDLFLSNEVIADLAASSIKDPQVQEYCNRYAIKLEEDQTWVNLGAWKLLESLWRVINRGGMGYISEFGDIYEIPTETIQLNHPEVSIHFGQLESIAQKIGFQTQLISLPDLLKMDLTQLWMAKHSYCGVRSFLHQQNSSISARAWHPTQFTHKNLHGIDWVPMTEPGPAPLPMRIWVLLIWKP